ncbi:MAG: alcohol dehydrogenase catalytic domain-containing protein [Deltaproteobacteria bacterium]|nr:alcohol dehydrogenase catalytic domain-containing protein [Deltaproteobacteria bacterium]MBI3390618.1 alcohol dehydrogenase catalytic domain-containing protein [Deltaproteobacteria bacterium]
MSESIAFRAFEYHADASLRPAPYRFVGSLTNGWDIERAGAQHLQLGPGYRLLRVSHCGVCSTDLARRHLPFPLPQVIGHEVVAHDESGAAVAVEINASHAARGLAWRQWCAFCRRGLDTHCPERVVLGIHDLPGGFGPWVLAPTANIVSIPPTISAKTATLIEPFAAALHAVQACDPRDGDRIAVLGPRRLGSLAIAALSAWRRQSGRRYQILAIARHAELRALARTLGADDAIDVDAAQSLHDVADCVVETTGSPSGLVLAIQLATREVHVKSTTGQPTLGLAHLTEMVVDEIALEAFRRSGAQRFEGLAAVLGDVPITVRRDLESRGLRVVTAASANELASIVAMEPLGGADVAVVTSLAGIDAAIRPLTSVERGLVRARGTILVADVDQPRDGLLAALLDKGLRISTTRCGDFRAAIALLADPVGGLGHQLGELMVTDVLPAARLAEAFAIAASPRSIKVVVTHPGGLKV